MIKEREKAQEIFNWIADTQFSIVYNSDGKLIPLKNLTEQIRYRAKTYVNFCFSNMNGVKNYEYWQNVKSEIDKCFYNLL